MDRLNYAVIDFETANGYRASACSLGMLKMINGKLDDSYYSLINPETYFDPYNTYIHGITEEDVSGAPAYPKIAGDIRAFIKDLPVVAHFAPFDTGVIRDSNQRYGIHFSFDYFDSYSLARSLIKSGIHSYKLDEVARYLGYRSFKHHHALEDCRACSFIIHELAVRHKAETIEELIHMGGYNCFGHVNQDESWRPFRKRRKSPAAPDTFRSLDFSKAGNADKSGYFYGKNVVFTGRLLKIQRKDAMQCIVDCGGIPQKSMNKKTNVLVIGKEDPKVVGPDGKSTKIKKAEKLVSEGIDIQVIGEDEFLKMIQ
ncbi:exonuclease domain-containing protein [Sporolactobacillus sp. CQH2019]|uniref:exonuclease domain-containing protein n=1 Tax=Sporolactobacillus sp. CQH2019 TaxID=3023512 RepID=UPI00236881A3|nr:exonuclease domain-containing protein [Sporolactobacillus sp. CQH2019]MDD9149580.1 exonuclease domain-containing protein [Sporolactobacillus sp. CQH2019]